MDEEQALEALSNVISALSEKPFDLSLHAQHIQLSALAGMDDQAHAAREILTTYYACADDVWLPLLEEKKKAADLNSIEGALSVWQAYNLAEEDYLWARSLPPTTIHGLTWRSHSITSPAYGLFNRQTCLLLVIERAFGLARGPVLEGVDS